MGLLRGLSTAKRSLALGSVLAVTVGAPACSAPSRDSTKTDDLRPSDLPVKVTSVKAASAAAFEATRWRLKKTLARYRHDSGCAITGRPRRKFRTYSAN